MKNYGKTMALSPVYIEHDYYPLDIQADVEYDNLREEGHRNLLSKRLEEEDQERRKGY